MSGKLFFLGAVFITLQAFAQPKLATQTISHVFQQFPEGSEIAIALVDQDSTIYLGFKKVAGEVIEVNNCQHYFEIGSLTKVFTASLLAFTHLNKLAVIDKKVEKSLPYKLNEKIHFTFKQLANHTSGLPRLSPNLMFEGMLNPDNPYQNYSQDKLENYLQQELELDRKPGEKFEYSNIGYGVLAYTLGLIWNQPFDSLLQEIFFTPFNMRETTYDRENIKHNLVEGLNGDGQTVSNWDFNAMKGAGGLYSTTEDLAKFAKQVLTKQHDFLTLTQEKTFAIQGDMSIGLGWHIIQDEDHPSSIYWHNGGTGGYTSSFAYDNQHAVIILTNLSALAKESRHIDPLCFSLLKDPEKD